MLHVELSRKETELKSNNTIIKKLENEIMNLREEQENNDIIAKKDGKTYNVKIRKACYYLQNLGVAQEKVSTAIKHVIKVLTGKEIESLPSYGIQYAMVKEMKHLSRQQAVTNSNLTLIYDGTTIKLGHLVEVELSTDNYIYLRSGNS